MRLGFSQSAIMLGSCVSLFLCTANVTAGERTAQSYIALYRTLLHGFTRETPDIVQTRVDYRGLRNEPRWRQLVAALGHVDPTLLETREQQLAFWINVYNIFAIDLVVRAYRQDHRCKKTTNEPEYGKPHGVVIKSQGTCQGRNHDHASESSRIAEKRVYLESGKG